MKHVNVILSWGYGFLALLLALNPGGAVGAKTLAPAKLNASTDYNRFSVLYYRAKNMDESVDRLRKMEDLRRSAQESLERLMTKGANPELELRYGELIVQRGRDLEQFSLEVGVSGDNKQAKALYDLSHSLLKKGLSLHAALLAKVANHPMAAKVYLGMARTQYGLGQKQAALNSSELGLAALRKHNMQKGEDTELQLSLLRGDSAFDLAKANIALDAYNHAKALVSEGSFEQAYILYKHAWVKYNLKSPEDAIEDLDKVFEITRDKFALRNEAVQDYALFSADLSRTALNSHGGLNGLYSHLAAVGDAGSAGRALENMGAIYSKNGRRPEAIEVLNFLIDQNMLDAQSVDRALTIVEWSHDLADKTKLNERYFWLINQFGPKSAWYAAQGSRAEIQKSSVDKIEASVRKYSTQLHQESMKENNEEVRGKAEDVVASLYDVHIANFSRPSDVPRADAGRVLFYRAEIHRRRQEWEEAGVRYDNYLRVLDLVPKDQVDKIDAKLHSEAVWGSVQVWARAIEKNPKAVAAMLAAADRFLHEYGRDPKAPQVLLDAARVEVKSANTSVAIGRLEQLIKLYPKTPQSLEAVRAELDILNKESDWINLAQSARRFMDHLEVWAPANERAKVKAELTKVLSQTEAKACEALFKQSGRQLEAALCFEAFAKGFANDPQAPKALLNAADIYDTLKDPSAAVTSLELLVKKYPNSEYSAKGFSRLATVYEKSFEFEKAVAIYETLLDKGGKTLPDREKLLGRLLALLEGLGQSRDFHVWLDKKNTPEAMRREFLEREMLQNFAAYRLEELTSGYSESGPGSERGRKLWNEIQSAEKKGYFTLEQQIESLRIRGQILRYAGHIDRADEEWLAALKKFWHAHDRSPGVLEAAARTRLGEAALWESAFKNTDLLKQPAKKGELFKKLEAWYAEVIEMKSPTIALEALWASAKLNADFADEVRNSPVPPELKAKGAEKQREAYTRLIHDRTEPMRAKALAIIEQIAIKAREWKILTPVVVAALKQVSDLHTGTQLPGQLVSASGRRMLQFPWPELPRWLELTEEQKKWEQWTLSDVDLKEMLLHSKARSESRHAAFVSLVRENSLGTPQVASWAKTFNDRPGVQLRVQAMLNDREFARASLFLDQYENFYGMDAFSEHHWGRLEWGRGNYSTAYARWIRPESDSAQKDFRSLYWAQGWGALLDQLIDGTPSRASRADTYAKLNSAAKTHWQRHYLAQLCLQGASECKGDYSPKKIVSVLTESTETPLAHHFADDRSGWQVHREALVSFIATGIAHTDNYEQLEDMRKALGTLYGLGAYLPEAKTFFSQYWNLRHQADLVQDRLDAQSKQKILVGVSK